MRSSSLIHLGALPLPSTILMAGEDSRGDPEAAADLQAPLLSAVSSHDLRVSESEPLKPNFWNATSNLIKVILGAGIMVSVRGTEGSCVEASLSPCEKTSGRRVHNMKRMTGSICYEFWVVGK